jgi:phosphoribosylanthranilate isomerase
MMIKVCGMRDPENIREVASLEPDLMGFIFYQRSPRFVDGKLPETAVKKVGVFVNSSVEKILETAEIQGLDYVQLHGEETPQTCGALKASGLGVIKVFGVDAGFSFAQTQAYEGQVDYFLFDTKGENYGGHGQKFDWGLLLQYVGETPFLVAGGIDHTSVDDLLSMRLPKMIGIDVNSKYEISPAVKDIEALKTLFLKVRNSNKQ